MPQLRYLSSLPYRTTQSALEAAVKTIDDTAQELATAAPEEMQALEQLRGVAVDAAAEVEAAVVQALGPAVEAVEGFVGSITQDPAVGDLIEAFKGVESTAEKEVGRFLSFTEQRLFPKGGGGGGASLGQQQSAAPSASEENPIPTSVDAMVTEEGVEGIEKEKDTAKSRFKIFGTVKSLMETTAVDSATTLSPASENPEVREKFQQFKSSAQNSGEVVRLTAESWKSLVKSLEGAPSATSPLGLETIEEGEKQVQGRGQGRVPMSVPASPLEDKSTDVTSTWPISKEAPQQLTSPSPLTPAPTASSATSATSTSTSAFASDVKEEKEVSDISPMRDLGWGKEEKVGIEQPAVDQREARGSGSPIARGRRAAAAEARAYRHALQRNWEALSGDRNVVELVVEG